MMGSGTAVVEATILQRRAIGFDIDPLALKIARVKTTHLPEKAVLEAGESIVLRARRLLERPRVLRDELKRRFDDTSRKFVDYWFLPRTQEELMALLLAIEEQSSNATRALLEILFSSIIVTKSGGVSLARDLAHTRPHRDDNKKVRDAIEQFHARLKRVGATVSYIPRNASKPILKRADARALPLPNDYVQLILTSPPYANAIDYMRAHKFSLVWLGKAIGELTELRSRYIGAEAIRNKQSRPDLPSFVNQQIERLEKRDERKASVLRQYFLDMRQAISEMYRVLEPGRACVIVVGSSTMRHIRIEAHRALAKIGEQVGFKLIDIAARKLDRDRRMLPVRRGTSSNHGIELRIHEEFLIAMAKS